MSQAFFFQIIIEAGAAFLGVNYLQCSATLLVIHLQDIFLFLAGSN